MIKMAKKTTFDNPTELAECLKSIGKSFYIRYFWIMWDLEPNAEDAVYLAKHTDTKINGAKRRLWNFRKIRQNRKTLAAIEIIINSKSVDPQVIKQACTLREFFEESAHA